MGGKSGTTTQSVSIPPEVLQRYNAVNTRAENVAQKPFQPYTGQFVAGITPTQQAGINATSQYAQAAQPYYQAATGQLGQAQGQGQQAIQQAFGSLGQGVDVGQQYAQAATQGIGAALQAGQPYQAAATNAAYSGAQALTPENINIQGYMSPYTQAVADTTFQALRQQQQQEMQGATANAIKSGAFGGDRAGLVAANLARQQQLGTAQAMAPIYQQGYGQALGSAMTAAQSNRAALQNLAGQLQGIGQQGFGQQMTAAQQMAGLGQQQFGQGLGAAGQLGALGQQQYGMGAGTAQQLAALGSGAQQSALQGAQAQLGAGTLEQQTQQADLTARYQQFLQERGYDFQVAQFLANIAMGTGALSGSTTTTTQPMPFFSDRRVKDNVKEIGKTHDGLPIYSYKYKGDDQTQIGLMAQDVEKKHPEAVYDMGGVKGVDYKQATEHAERPERYSGGLVPASQGGSVYEPGAYARGGYALGGHLTDPNDIQALLAMQQEGFGPFGESGLYGGSAANAPYGGVKGVVPQSRLHTPRLLQPGAAPRMPESGTQQALSAFDSAMGMKDRYDKVKEIVAGKKTPQREVDEGRPALTTREEVKNLAGPDIKAPASKEEDKGILDYISSFFMADGGVVPRHAYAVGGTSKDPSLPYEEDDKSPYKYFPTEILDTEKAELPKPGQPPAQTSQTGVGLGTLLGLFLKDGGVVPRARMANGGVYDPTMGRIVSTEMSPIDELNKEDIYSRELQAAAAPRFRVFERIAREEGAKGLKPTELYRSPERSAMLDLTMPEGAPRAKPYTSGHNYGLAVDYSNTTPENYDAIRKAAAATGLTTGLDFSNVDPPHVQLGKGSYGGLYGKDVVIDEGFGKRSQKGVVPAEAQEAAYAAARSARPDLPERGATTASSSEESGLLPSMKNYFAENQSWLVPFGAGLKGMVQSRSPFLGAAVLEGVGSGLEALGGAQEQMARTEQLRAASDQTRAETAIKSFHQTPYGNFMWVKDPVTGAPTLVTAIEYQRNKDKYQVAFAPPPTRQEAEQARAQSGEMGEETAPSTGGPTPPTGGQPAPDDKSLVTVAPPGTLYDGKSQEAARSAESRVEEAQLRGGPNAILPYEIGEKYIKETESAAIAAQNNQMFVNEYTKNLAKATTLGGFNVAGFQFDNRAAITGMLDTMFRALGAGSISSADDVKAIQSKVESMRGAMMSTQAGQESYHALKMLADANANPNMDPKAYAELAAMMMVQERRNIDRANHAQQWGKDSGQIYYGAGQDFERVYNTGEMMRQAQVLAHMMRNAPVAFQDLMSGKYDAKQINEDLFKKYGVENMSRFFVGGAQ